MLTPVATLYPTSGDSDYVKQSRYSVTFRAREYSASFTVAIRDNEEFERTEYFYFELEIPPTVARYYHVIEGSSNRTFVYIIDDGR